MRKADYIAKYGEEAWEIEAEKIKEYQKQYYHNNKERIAERNKQYKEANREQIAELNKRYYQENKEKYLQKRRWYYQDNKKKCTQYNEQYYQDNKDHIVELRKQYYQDNKDYIAEQRKQYRSTQFGRAFYLKSSYIRTDKEKGFPTDQNIDEDWIIENIFGSQCIYCGDSDWTHLGADRIDNTKGHTPENCVCACEKCNKGRRDRYTVEEFIQHMQAKSLSKHTKVYKALNNEH